MKKRFFFLFLTVTFFSTSVAFHSYAQKKQKAAEQPHPKLVAGIVVDQMRWDYLHRFYDRYGEDGFKRMMNTGFNANNTNIDYVPTVTAIGHTTVYTGSVPSVHGITGNRFMINATGQTTYCTDDTSVATVGSISMAGRALSARHIGVAEITDALGLATIFPLKEIGVVM